MLEKMLRSILLVIFLALIYKGQSASASPTWEVNALLNSGEHKAIYQTNGVQIAASTFPVGQTFQTAFASPPRVVLSMEGFKQNQPTCVGCQVGFKHEITSTTASGFSASLTIYGSNMTFLFYMYLGISASATQYFTSFNILEFSSNQLTNTASASRSVSLQFSNPAGETFPLYQTNIITNLIYLAGYKMNLGTTGVYINISSTIDTADTHSVMISTKGDVQIFQVSYYRLAFDKTSIMSGMVNVIDLFSFVGANNLQLPTVVVVDPTPINYRNYLMGFNKINIANPSAGADIMLQFYLTTQTIFKSSSVMYTFTNATFEYLSADVFQHRKRVCAAATPYFYYNTVLCYDVCPSRTFNVEATKYCEVCHFSCLTCNGIDSQDCLTCEASDNRGFDAGRCLCNTGYYQNNVTVCPSCSPQCQTCQSSSNLCTSCYSSHNRQLSPTNSSCTCLPSFFQVSLLSPLTCLPCSPTCLTCSLTLQNCTSCFENRNLSLSSSNTCICSDQYYETVDGLGETICLACSPRCLTCVEVETACVTCNANRYHTNPGSVGDCLCNTGTIESATAGDCTPQISTCGNRIIQPGQQCDDGNTQSSDGCSSRCEIQAKHNCSTRTNSTQSVCYYNEPLNMTITSVLKLLSENKVAILLQVQAQFCNLDRLKTYLEALTGLILGSSARLLTRARVMQTDVLFILSSAFRVTDPAAYTGELALQLEYTQSIDTLSNRQLRLLSSNSQNPDQAQSYFFATPLTSVSLQDPHNKVPMTYLEQSSYKLTSVISYIFLVVFLLNLIFFIFTVFARRSVVGMQTVLVGQFVYFSIIGLSEIGVGVGALALFGKFSVGVNVSIVQNILISSNNVQYQVCKKMAAIYQECNAINNINITFYLAVITLLFYLACQSYKYKRQRALENISNQTSKQAGKPTDGSEPSDMSQRGQEQQTISNQSSLPLTYTLPQKIQKICVICLQYSFGLCFLTTIQYMLTVMNLDEIKIQAIVWLTLIGFVFIAVWVIWFKCYPIQELSYVSVLKKNILKITVEKFAFLIYLLFLAIWGVILSIAPGIAAYASLIVWCMFWMFLTVKKQIHRSRIHKLRSAIVQILTILISITFILIEYTPKDGFGLIFTIVLLFLLITNFGVNVGFLLYDEHLERKNSKIIDDLSSFKQVQDQFQAYNSVKMNELSNSESNRQKSSIKNAKMEMITPRRDCLLTVSQVRQTARNKLTELKTLRKQLKFIQQGIADERKVQLLSSIRKIEDQRSNLQAQSSFLKDL